MRFVGLVIKKVDKKADAKGKKSGTGKKGDGGKVEKA